MLRVLVIDPAEAVLPHDATRVPAVWEVTRVATGAQAIAAIRRGLRFDAIVCAVDLPDFGALAVREAIAALAMDQAGRMVFAGVASAGWDLMVKVRREGYRFLPMPCTEEALLAAMESVRLRPGSR